MKILKTLAVVVILLLLVVISLRVVWGVRENKQISILLLDKTVLNYDYEDHKSFFWVLKHNKYFKKDDEPYSFKHDYFGFQPKEPERNRNYDINRIKITGIDQLALQYDILYVIDCRGVFFNEWYKGIHSRDKASLIYGGITQNDYLLIKKYLDNSKPMICEYQLFQAPTDGLYRLKTEELLDIHWMDWVGKYYTSLQETKDTKVPGWLINEYKTRNGGKWPFVNGGIILMKGREDFIVLEEGKELKHGAPILKTTADFSKTYALPSEIDFTNWFEVVSPGNTNTSLAYFLLDVNPEGKEALEARGLSTEFPAILINNAKPAFYFAGDMSEIPVPMPCASLASGEKLGAMLSGKESDFFWDFYNPLMKGILKSFTESIK